MTPERLAELKARASRPRRTVPIICNGELAQQIDNLQAELELLDRPAEDRRLSSRGNDAQMARLEAELDALYEQVEGDTLLVVVEGLEGSTWRALLAAHPPKPVKEGESPRVGFDAWCDRVSLEEPLIRASAIGMRARPDAEIEPLADGTLDWLLAFITAPQRDTLFVAAWVCSRGDDAVPLRLRRSTTTSSDGASAPPGRSASRRAASTAGSRRKSTSTTTPTGT